MIGILRNWVRRHPEQILSARASSAPRFDPLESRVMLTTVNVFAYVDVNGDGQFNAGDHKLNGVQVFIDHNQNGKYDDGSVSTLTATDDDLGPGVAVFEDITEDNFPGTVRPRDPNFFAALPGGAVRTTPSHIFVAADPADVGDTGGVIGSGATDATIDVYFGFTFPRRITGQVFNDRDGSGAKDNGETGVKNRIVWLDTNNNGKLDKGEKTSVTDGNGFYNFLNTLPGRYMVRTNLGPQTQGTGNTPGQKVVTVDGDTDAVTVPVTQNFSVAQPGSVSGTLFFDTDGNGMQDGGEPVYVNRRVFADANFDGVQQSNEKFGVTDSAGLYTITGLVPKHYRITPVIGSMIVATSPTSGFQPVVVQGGMTTTAQDFGFTLATTVSGVVFTDINGNGTKDAGDAGRTGITVYADINGNGTKDTGEAFAITSGTGAYTITGLLPGTYTISVVGSGFTVPSTGSQAATTSAGVNATGINFGLATPGSVTGSVFGDANGNGVRNGAETGLAGQTVFVDLDGDGIRDTGEPSDTTDATGNFSIANVGPGTYSVVIVNAAGTTVTTAGGDTQTGVTVTSGTATTNINFGVFSNITLSGTVYADANADGNQGGAETGVFNSTVYIDTDNDGVLDAGETTATTGADGSYTFNITSAGTYVVRVVIGGNQTVTEPVNGAYTVIAAQGQTFTARDFGIANTGSVSGLVYTDTDASGTQDAGENGRANVVVFVDANANDTFDAGEKNATTDANGNYTLTFVPVGSRTIVVVPPGGSTVTQPAASDSYTAVVTQGGNATGGLFGINP